MRTFVLLPLVVVAAFAVAACGGGGGTSAAPTSAAASEPAASAGGGAAGGAACTAGEAGGTADVTVEIKDFKFNPADVTASVGQAIGWTNGDSAPHTATLDDGSCDTGNLSQGATGLLVFNEAGTYEYHCNIHSNMTGTITVS
jgi:plastocyanin